MILVSGSSKDKPVEASTSLSHCERISGVLNTARTASRSSASELGSHVTSATARTMSAFRLESNLRWTRTWEGSSGASLFTKGPGTATSVAPLPLRLLLLDAAVASVLVLERDAAPVARVGSVEGEAGTETGFHAFECGLVRSDCKWASADSSAFE